MTSQGEVVEDFVSALLLAQSVMMGGGGQNSPKIMWRHLWMTPASIFALCEVGILKLEQYWKTSGLMRAAKAS